MGGNNLFGANIAGQIASALGPLLLPGKLIQVSEGAIDPLNPLAGSAKTETEVLFRGIVSDYTDSRVVEGSLVQTSDRRVLMLASTFSTDVVPKIGDKIEIENTTYTITATPSRDPDAATYTCTVEGL